jgi:phosphoribosyl 1,2-cyclic phosphate phosphodiesterase
MSVDEAVALAAEVAPGQTWFTHLSHDILHSEAEAALPAGVGIAYDGLKIAI